MDSEKIRNKEQTKTDLKFEEIKDDFVNTLLKIADENNKENNVGQSNALDEASIRHIKEDMQNTESSNETDAVTKYFEDLKNSGKLDDLSEEESYDLYRILTSFTDYNSTSRADLVDKWVEKRREKIIANETPVEKNTRLVSEAETLGGLLKTLKNIDSIPCTEEEIFSAWRKETPIENITEECGLRTKIKRLKREQVDRHIERSKNLEGLFDCLEKVPSLDFDNEKVAEELKKYLESGKILTEIERVEGMPWEVWDKAKELYKKENLIKDDEEKKKKVRDQIYNTPSGFVKGKLVGAEYGGTATIQTAYGKIDVKQG